MDRDPIKTAVRERRRKQRMGDARACACCGVTDLECLNGRTIIEDHHALGKAHEGHLTLPLCLNCHARASETQRKNCVDLSPQRTILDRLIACLRGIIAFLGDLLQVAERWLENLEEFVKQLDARLPSWRSLVGELP